MYQHCLQSTLKRRASICALAAILLTLLNGASIVVLAQASPAKPAAVRRSPDELRAILANQPDFIASVSGCSVKRHTDVGRVGQLAKRADTYRIEVSESIFGRGPQGTISLGQIAWLVTLGKGPDDEPATTALVPERRVYFTDGEDFENGVFVAVLATPYVSFLSPQWLADVCGLRDAGTDLVHGLNCLKIEVATRDGALLVFYCAEKLDNLVVRIVVREFPSVELGGPFLSFDFDGAVIDLNDVKLDPPLELFDVPSGYRQLKTPKLYLEEGAVHAKNPEPKTACAEPSSSGEVSRKELCEVPVPKNMAPVCSGITTECGALHSGESCKLQANASDLEGDVLKYTWTTTGGQLANGNSSESSFDATGLAPGKYVVTVTADDGHGHTVSCSTTIEVLPND